MLCSVVGQIFPEVSKEHNFSIFRVKHPRWTHSEYEGIASFSNIVNYLRADTPLVCGIPETSPVTQPWRTQAPCIIHGFEEINSNGHIQNLTCYGLFHEHHFERVKGNVLLHMQQVMEHTYKRLEEFNMSFASIKDKEIYGIEKIRIPRDSC